MEIWACETVTGDKLATVPITAASWETVLNGAGTIDATVPLARLNPRRAELMRSYLEAGRMSLAVITDGGEVTEAGPIWKDDYDDATGDWKLGASGLWSIFDRRKLIIWDWKIGDPVQESTLGTVTASLDDLTFAVVRFGYLRGTLPLALEADPSGSLPTATKEWGGYELRWVGDVLRDLTSTGGGPELAFQPRIREDRRGIEWVVRVGLPLLTQKGDDWRWSRGAPRSRLLGVSVSSDASGMAQRAWAVGGGTEKGITIGVAEDVSPLERGYPLTEVDAPVSNEVDETAAGSRAQSALAAAVRPWQTITIRAAAERPGSPIARPGDWGTLTIPEGHPRLPAGPIRTRIMSISGDQGKTSTYRLAPVMEKR